MNLAYLFDLYMNLLVHVFRISISVCHSQNRLLVHCHGLVATPLLYRLKDKNKNCSNPQHDALILSGTTYYTIHSKQVDAWDASCVFRNGNTCVNIVYSRVLRLNICVQILCM